MGDPQRITLDSLIYNPNRPPGFKPIRQRVPKKKEEKFGPPETLSQARKHLECYQLKKRLSQETNELKKRKLRKKIKEKKC
jgi:hypothetical protein